MGFTSRSTTETSASPANALQSLDEVDDDGYRELAPTLFTFLCRLALASKPFRPALITHRQLTRRLCFVDVEADDDAPRENDATPPPLVAAIIISFANIVRSFVV